MLTCYEICVAIHRIPSINGYNNNHSSTLYLVFILIESLSGQGQAHHVFTAQRFSDLSRPKRCHIWERETTPKLIWKILLCKIFSFWNYSFSIEGLSISNQQLLLCGVPATLWPHLYLFIVIIALKSKRYWQNITKIISKPVMYQIPLSFFFHYNYVTSNERDSWLSLVDNT